MAEDDHTENMGKPAIENGRNRLKPSNLIEEIKDRIGVQQDHLGEFKTHLWNE